MKIIVRRKAKEALDDSFNQIEKKYQTCYGEDNTETFIKSLELSQDDDCLNIVGDVILCNDFIKEIQNAVPQFPDKIITFFSLKDINVTTEMPSKTFQVCKCVYLPKWANIGLKKYCSYWKKQKRGVDNPNRYDYMIADFMGMMGKRYILSLPYLVQDKNGEKTIFFKDN